MAAQKNISQNVKLVCVCEARIYVLCVCMQIRVMQLFPALVANTNTHTHTKATAVPAITLWCFGQFVLVGGLFQLQLEFHHKLPYNPFPFSFPPSAFHTIRHACACSFGCETTMSGGAQPFSACYYVVALSQTNDCVCAVCTRVCVCVCEFSAIPCGYCHSACR